MEKFAFSWDDIHRDSKVLAKNLLKVRTWDKIIAVARGGLVPACIVARELNIRHLDTISIASYDHDQQGDIKLLTDLTRFKSGADYLIIDDIVDSGKTFQALREYLPDAYYAAVYVKESGLPTIDSYGSKIEQEVWYDFPWDLEHSYSKPLAEQEI